MGELAAWRTWWIKRRWYERNRRPGRRWRINRHMARVGAFIRYPIEGEVLEALDAGRLTVGENTLFEPGCWLTFGPGAEIHIGRECFLNRGTMLAAADRIIDLGPEGGEAGGEVVATGTPEQIAASPASYTGQFLRSLVEPAERPARRRPVRRRREPVPA